MKKLRRLKKGLAVLLSLAMVAGLMPDVGIIQASAAGSEETVDAFKVTGGTLGTDYTYADGVLTIKSATPITIANTNPNTATTDRIEVASLVGANITLDGVNIDVSSIANTAAFKIADNSTGNVTITLANGLENTLKSGTGCAGLQKNGSGEDIGKLTAIGGVSGAGIGGGDGGSGSNIEISGGSVKAVAGTDANDIGGGSGKEAVTPTSDGTTPVYLLEIENEGGADITINNTAYPTNHNGEKKIYAYLPAKTVAEPNVVVVGTETTKYVYETMWRIIQTGGYDAEGFCINYEWKDGSLVLKDGIADDHKDCNGYQPATWTTDKYDLNKDNKKG